MTQPSEADAKLIDKVDNPQIGEQAAAIVTLVDALNGATFTGDTLTTSATPTVDELEAAVGSNAGKINAILAVLRLHGLIAD